MVLSHSPALTYVPTPEAFAQDKAQDYEVQNARGMGMSADAADRELAAVERGLAALSA